MKTKKLLIIALVAATAACGRYNPKVVSSEFLPVKEAECTDAIFNQKMDSFRTRITSEMDVVIGYAPEKLAKTECEGLLNNLVAEIMLNYAKTLRTTDIAITNKGGLRCDIQQGDVTIGNIFELMPFDNRIVLLEMSGTEVEKLCQCIAKKGGDAVSGISMTITKKGEAKNIKIGKKPINKAKKYVVVTSDYLSQGMDGLEPLANYTKLEATNTVMSQMIIDGIKAKTAKNQPITTTVKNNIYVEK